MAFRDNLTYSTRRAYRPLLFIGLEPAISIILREANLLTEKLHPPLLPLKDIPILLPFASKLTFYHWEGRETAQSFDGKHIGFP